ncbi:MAG: hypothetical protein M3389_11625 [Actinomycetota bacterium]|nr:hypothetical protein [Actinomycetota bacterium]
MPRALLALLALLALAAGLVACGDDSDGGGGGSDDPAAVAARAVKATQSADSYRVAVKLDSDLGGQKLFAEGEGVSSADQSRGYFEMDFAVGGAEPAPVVMITDGGENFMKGGPFEELLPAGKTWLKVDDATASTMTPAEFIEFLRESENIEDAGSEQVRGKDTVHLRGPLDFKKLAENTDSATAKRFAQMPQIEEIDATIDVWVDKGDDRIARMKLAMSHPDATGSMKVDADILEYDVPLDKAKAPPAGEVAEAQGLGG